MLRHIHYYRIHDYVEQIALLNTLPAFLKEHPEVRCLLLGSEKNRTQADVSCTQPQVQLVVIDSITFHFRHDFDDYMARTRVLTSMAQTLMSLADEFRLAVPPLISVPGDDARPTALVHSQQRSLVLTSECACARWC